MFDTTLRRKRAQGSTEFIILLALVLILSGIVVSLFLSSGQDTSRVTTQSKNLASASAPIGIQNVGFSARGIYFSLVNNEHGIVEITEITVGDTVLNSSLLPLILLPNEQRDFYDYTLLFNKSEPYTYDVSYTYTVSGISKTFDGLSFSGSVPQVEDYSIHYYEPLAKDLQFLLQFENDEYLDENATTYVDVMGKVRDDCALLARCPTRISEGFGNALFLDGINDYLQFNQTFANDDNATISFWLKTNQTIDLTKIFFSSYVSGFGAKGIRVEAQSSTKLRFVIGMILSEPDVPDFTDNEWHHFAFLVTPGRMDTYFDGTLVDDTSVANPKVQSSLPYTIGASSMGLQNILGTIDEFGIWSRALSDQEISALYHRGAEHFDLQ